MVLNLNIGSKDSQCSSRELLYIVLEIKMQGTNLCITGCPDSNLYNLIMSDRQKYGSLIWFNGFPEELRCGNFT